ncbi:PPE domain-containing protein [Mycobacterium sp. SMC-4]|uniref:PPE domain-containing protein n=1 Tax=Mycobacterium sp. SMC-4 TaxID=2857059 RepID=UPI0021B4BB5E|nr:PPE domain-containing protein [Mycobacterium sp. SMC-4]UXA18243.1 PPE domain-containing protein [Mycobacterium sp. SMC-4]
MSSEEVQVEPEDLHRKATQIESLVWTSASAQPELVAPDALIVSSVAVTNLAVNARALWAHQQFGKIEGTRLAQTLHNVADAYAQIDQASAQDIAATIDGDGTPLADTTVYPKAVTTPAPPRPPAMPIPKGQPPADQMMFPPDAQRALDAGDHGASLQAVAQLWRSNAQTLEGSARQFEVNSVLWEGAAADAAYAKFTRYRDWLIGLAESWKRLAGEADRIAQAHRTARQDHHPVADEYQQLHDSVMGKPLSPYTYSTMERMAELQARSESLRNAYARDGQPYQITPEEPPNPVVSGVPVTLQDHRHARRADPRSDDSRRGAPSAGNGSSSEAGGGAPRPTQHAATSPAGGSPAATQAPEGNSPAGSPSGGAPSSGAPSGATPGGAPGAGSPGSTAPTHPKPEPTFPRGPSVQPAAHSGAGAGGGGGGAGVPAGPLQPAVSAETVAPTPVVAPSAPAPAQGAGGSGGAAMGGGMGGMAPMMHGAQGNTGEKKRNPQLSEDEELYTEDRPWTEPVVGNRARRRGASDDSRKES